MTTIDREVGCKIQYTHVGGHYFFIPFYKLEPSVLDLECELRKQ